MRRGYTLPDLMTACAIMILLSASILPLIFHAYEVIIRFEDAFFAKRRYEYAATIIRPMIESAGFGISHSSEKMKRSFGSGQGGSPPFNWDGPISISTYGPLSARREQAQLRVIYAVDSGARMIDEVRTDDIAFDGRITDGLDSGNYSIRSVPNSIKCWFTTGAAAPYRYPFYMASSPTGSGGVISCRFRRGDAEHELFIPKNDELFYLRAAEISTVYDILYDDYYLRIDDMLGSGQQPKIDGIVDLRFEFDEPGGLMHVWFLIRGKKRYGKQVTLGCPDGWPAQWSQDVPKDMRYYRLFAYHCAYRVYNY